MTKIFIGIIFFQLLFPAFDDIDRDIYLFGDVLKDKSWGCSSTVILPYNRIYLSQYQTVGYANLGRFSSNFKIAMTGDKIYRETVFQVNTGFWIISKIKQSLKLSLYQLRIKGYGSAICSTVGFISYYSITDKLSLKIQFDNILKNKGSSLAEGISEKGFLQISQSVASSQFLIYILEKDGNFAPNHSVFWTFNPVLFLNCRLGYSSLTKEILISGSVKYQNFTIICGSALHPILGTTFGLHFGYN